ncbi:putative cycloheximide resistance protein [Erysiphe necator]|uniref:Putative cycloheximide resistance protein n=1 Tax=Uncinula necator TaxID=52586 RepID=A0A0B1NUG2_UNCNE|nr:putative cycloheximide resistance protein [Erysiphe necator]
MATTKKSALDQPGSNFLLSSNLNHESKGNNITVNIFSEKSEEKTISTISGDVSQEFDSEYLVSWDKQLDPLNPVNFSIPLKILNTGLITLVCCLNIAAIGILAPSASSILSEFKAQNASLGSLVVSIYILGLGFGPLIMAPLSEVIGRVPVYNLSVFGFVIFNICCAKSTSLQILIFFRFLSGVFGSVTETNGGASISDLFSPSQRGLVLTLYALGPVIAGIISPVIGGFITDGLGWRWIFWLLAIMSGIFGTLGMVFLRETYAPVILERKAARLRKETGNMRFRSVFQNNTSSRKTFLLAFVRPFKLLIFSPIIFSTAIFLGLVNGYQYLMLTSYSSIFRNQYHFSISAISLSYLGAGVGCLLGLFIFAIQTTILYGSQKNKETGLEPETRLRGIIWTYALMPLGLLLYGWTAQEKLHWLLPILGTGVISCGSLHVFLCILVYVIDCFPLHAASASTGNTFLRNSVATVIPLAGPPMFKSLGVGWGCSLLALISCILLPFPWTIMKYSATLRSRYVVKNI